MRIKGVASVMLVSLLSVAGEAPRNTAAGEGEGDAGWYCGTTYNYNTGSEWIPLIKHSDVYAPHPKTGTFSSFETHSNEVGGSMFDHGSFFGRDHTPCES